MGFDKRIDDQEADAFSLNALDDGLDIRQANDRAVLRRLGDNEWALSSGVEPELAAQISGRDIPLLHDREPRRRRSSFRSSSLFQTHALMVS